jgi:hypothetical protein
MTLLIQEGVGEIQTKQEKICTLSQQEKTTVGIVSFFVYVHLLPRGSGPCFVKELWRFSVQALLRAVTVYCAIAVVFFLTPLALGGQELQLGPLPLSVRIPPPIQ